MLTDLFLRQAELASRLTGEAVPDALLAAFSERGAALPARKTADTPSEENAAQLEELVAQATEIISKTRVSSDETTKWSATEQTVWNALAQQTAAARDAAAVQAGSAAPDMAAISRFFERDARRYG